MYRTSGFPIPCICHSVWRQARTRRVKAGRAVGVLAPDHRGPQVALAGVVGCARVTEIIGGRYQK